MGDGGDRRRLSAVLAADVVGYTRLVEKDTDGTVAAWRTARATIIDPTIAARAGRIVKVTGDGFLAEFPSVLDAVTCAVALQEALFENPLDFRMGVNLGDVVDDGEDIHGEGVNIAARIEALADPGGICISGAVHDQIRNRVDQAFADMGEHQVKHVSAPVRVWRWTPAGMGETATGETSHGQGSDPPENPSIAVLPFANLSGDPEQEYFSDGLTHDIITQLSRFRDLLVIASNSTFTYKDRPTKIQDVSRELGVRYVLEGSVRRAGDRVRISVELIDGQSGRHLWTERYDRLLDDVFKVQDDVTEMIVGTLASGYGGRLRKAWQRRAQEGRSANLQAFDCLMRGLDILDSWTKEDNLRGRALVEQAIDLDPTYAKAYGKLAWTYILEAIEGWGADYDALLEKGRECAVKGIEIEDTESWAHWALAGYYFYVQRYDLALAEFDRAVSLNPNDADVLSDAGYYLAYAGKAEEGLKLALKGMRLNPHFPEYYLMQLGQIQFDARQYEDAIASFDGLRTLETALSCLYLAAAHAALGQADAAQAAIRRVLALDPAATRRKWTRAKLAPYKNPEDLAHFDDNLRKAGLPD